MMVESRPTGRPVGSGGPVAAVAPDMADECTPELSRRRGNTADEPSESCRVPDGPEATTRPPSQDRDGTRQHRPESISYAHRGQTTTWGLRAHGTGPDEEHRRQHT